MTQTNNVIIVGDLNLGFIDWRRGFDDANEMIPANYSSALGSALIDMMSLNNLKQYNNIPNSDGRYLDLVMSTIPGVSVSRPLDLVS